MRETLIRSLQRALVLAVALCGVAVTVGVSDAHADYDLTITSGNALTNVTPSTVGPTTTFTASNTGATLGIDQITAAAGGASTIVIRTDGGGGEVGNITATVPLTISPSLELIGNGTVDLVSATSTAGSVLVDGATLVPGSGLTAATTVVVQSGAVSYGGANPTFVTSAGGIRIDGTIDGSGALTVNAGTNSVELRSAVGSTLAPASVNATGNSVSFEGGAVTTAGSQTYTGVVELRANTTLASTTAGAITLPPVSGAFGLTVSTAGTTTFGGSIGPAAAPDPTSITTDAPGTNVIGGSELNVAGAVALGGATRLSATTAISATGTTTMAALDATAAGAQSLTTTGTTVYNGSIGATQALGSLTSTGSAVVRGNIATTGTQTWGGATKFDAANLTVTAGGALSFASDVTGNGIAVTNVTFNSPGATTFGAPVFDIDNVTTDAPGTTVLGAPTFDSFAAFTFNDPVTLSATLDIDADEVTFASTLNGEFPLNMAGVNDTTFSGNVGGTSPIGNVIVGTSGSNVTLGASTFASTGTVSLRRLTLASSVAVAGTTVDFLGTVNGAHGLTVNGSTATSFAAAVGATTPPTSIVILGPAATATAPVRTSGNQTWSALTMGGTSTLTSTAGGISVGGGLTLPTAATTRAVTPTTTMNVAGPLTFTVATPGAVGSSVVLVALSGAAPVVGTFAGLPEGGTTFQGGALWRITYAGGDGNDIAATRIARTTTASLAQSAAASTEGDSVTLTGTFTSAPGPALTGTATFTAGATVLGTAPVASGTATLATTAIPVGAQELRVAIAANSDATAATSVPIQHTVSAKPVPPVAEPPVVVPPVVVPPVVVPPVDPPVVPVVAPISKVYTNGSCLRVGRGDIQVAYTLATTAKVTYTVQRRVRPISPQLRRCPATVSVGSGTVRSAFAKLRALARGEKPGRRTVRVADVTKGAKLTPGVYRLTIDARDTKGKRLGLVTRSFIVLAG